MTPRLPADPSVACTSYASYGGTQHRQTGPRRNSRKQGQKYGAAFWPIIAASKKGIFLAQNTPNRFVETLELLLSPTPFLCASRVPLSLSLSLSLSLPFFLSVPPAVNLFLVSISRHTDPHLQSLCPQHNPAAVFRNDCGLIGKGFGSGTIVDRRTSPNSNGSKTTTSNRSKSSSNDSNRSNKQTNNNTSKKKGEFKPGITTRI